MRKPKAVAPPVYAKPADMGPEPELIWIPVTQMFVDRTYQRSTETPGGQALIETIAREFQWAKFQVCVVTQRADGMYAVIDGQHRRAAAIKCGLETLPCLVVTPPDYRGEADIFVGVNTGRTNVQPYQLFWSKLAAGRPDAKAVEIVCERAGVTIPRTVDAGAVHRQAPHLLPPRTTIAIAAITAAIKRHGMDIVAEALAVLAAAYPDRGGQIRQTSIRGVAEYLQRHGAHRKDVLISLLRATGIDALDAAALVVRPQHSNGAQAFAAVLDVRVRRLTAPPLLAASAPVTAALDRKPDAPRTASSQPASPMPISARAAAVAQAVSIMRAPATQPATPRPSVSIVAEPQKGVVTCSCKRHFRPEWPGQDKCNLCRKSKGAVEPMDAAD